MARAKLTNPDGTFNGRVVSMDILPMKPIEGVDFLQGDFREESVEAQLNAMVAGGKVEAVVSDMAPNLSGVAMVDAGASLYLCELALDFAVQHLTPDGILSRRYSRDRATRSTSKPAKRSLRSCISANPRQAAIQVPKCTWWGAD